MLIRPPSNQGLYDEFYSRDPAFVQPNLDGLTPEQQKQALADHARAIARARELGDWTPLAVPGATPTRFVLRPVRSGPMRTLMDQVSSGKLGTSAAAALAFRAALHEVVNFGDFDLEHENHPIFGKIASDAIIDALDAIHIGIVNELGDRVVRRAIEIPPKS